jgi:hypothetical protein
VADPHYDEDQAQQLRTVHLLSLFDERGYGSCGFDSSGGRLELRDGLSGK